MFKMMLNWLQKLKNYKINISKDNEYLFSLQI